MPSAKRDIDEIWEYISKELCAPEAARDLLTKIINTIERLKDFPLSGKKLNLRLPLKREYRRIVIENYLLFYTVEESKKEAYVMRILYGPSDYQKLLNLDQE